MRRKRCAEDIKNFSHVRYSVKITIIIKKKQGKKKNKNDAVYMMDPRVLDEDYPRPPLPMTINNTHINLRSDIYWGGIKCTALLITGNAAGQSERIKGSGAPGTFKVTENRSQRNERKSAEERKDLRL